jgi:hypothetical protein
VQLVVDTKVVEEAPAERELDRTHTCKSLYIRQLQFAPFISHKTVVDKSITSGVEAHHLCQRSFGWWLSGLPQCADKGGE